MLFDDAPTLHVVDLTAEQKNPPVNVEPQHRIVRGKTPAANRVLCRPVGSIDGVVIHQTATPYGVTRDQVKASGGDAVLAKHRRALKVSAHMTCFATGYAVHAHPLDWYVYHANGLNARSIGIEIEGSFPFAMGPELMSPELVRAARDGLQYVVTKGREAGMP